MKQQKKLARKRNVQIERREKERRTRAQLTFFTLAIFPFISLHVFKSLLPLWGTEPKKLESYNEKKYKKYKNWVRETAFLLFCINPITQSLFSFVILRFTISSQSQLLSLLSPLLVVLWQKNVLYVSHIVYRGMDNSDSLPLLRLYGEVWWISLLFLSYSSSSLLFGSLLRVDLSGWAE